MSSKLTRTMFLKSPLLLLIASFLMPCSSADPSPLVMEWSNTTYGPDGPWQAISVKIGSPMQAIDLLPGGSWTSNILSTSLCTNITNCPQSAAGIFNASASSSYNQINDTGIIDSTSFANQTGALPMLAGSAHTGLDTLTISTSPVDLMVENFELLVIESAQETLGNGSTYTPQIGTLALGAPVSNQSFSSPNLTGNFLPSALYSQDKIPSNSFGLHIGSATQNISGSLVLGGYDESRIVGDILTASTTDGTFPLSLKSMLIGVEEGATVFPFVAHQEVLFNDATAAASNDALPVTIDPSVPYLYLPASTCDNIATYLPITYDSSLQLYIWNTTSPLFVPITTSPSYLFFQLSATPPSLQIIVKIPFSLLSLQLTSPLTNTSDPVYYFPCQPVTLPTFGTPVWTLGRAFLQAAFFGVNWSNDTSSNSTFFLAQAPGPSLPSSNILSISPDATSLTSNKTSTDGWYTSWKDHWTPINSTLAKSLGGSTAASKPFLSKGATIGVSVGAGVAGCILLFGLFWTWKRGVNVRKQRLAEEQAILEGRMDARETEMGRKGWGWIQLEDTDLGDGVPPEKMGNY